MDHPLYIAPDEEIISVIARLRTLPESSVTLVFPKHSVVTQSIINLKLLAREGEKLSKKLTLVSQNENARSLAEKIGFATLPYTQELEKASIPVASSPDILEAEVDTPAPSLNRAPREEPNEADLYRPKSTDIGSQNFYAAPGTGAPETKKMGDIKPTSEPKPPVTEPTTLRIRNLSPERSPSLNSLREPTLVAPPDLSAQSTVSAPIFPDNHMPAAGAPLSQERRESDAPTAIKEFFARRDPREMGAVRMPDSRMAPAKPPRFVKKGAVVNKPPVMVGKGMSSKLTWLFSVAVILFVLALGFLFFFLVFPTAKVTISPQTLNESYDQSFTLDTAGTGGEIPLTKNTREVTAKIAGIASGAGGSATESGSKAKGVLRIVNNYSAEPQPLVASTRFEAPNGKIYRIQENITVPGNGSIEAQVIADGSGESYNMNEGTFTIPGFKGTDKYEKFSAALVGSISGGSGEETVSGGTFIRSDEETLRARALEEAKRIFTEEVGTETGDTHTFTDGLIAERVTETSLPRVGTVPGEYEYSAVFKITAFTVSKDAVTKALVKNIRTEYDNILFTPTAQEVSFTDFTVTEDGKQASLKAHLETTLSAALDENKIKEDLAGKSAADLEDFTARHPEIKGLSISFHPSWALKRIPKNPEKIELAVE